MNLSELPVAIQKRIEDKQYKLDKIGESVGQVLIFDDMVLKIEETGRHSNREYNALKWLQGKLPVPEVILFEQLNGYNYLIMTRIKEKTLIDDIMNCNPRKIVEAMADGIKQFWSIDISDCPFDSRLSSQLLEAKHRIHNGLVDTEDFEKDTLGKNGFNSVDDLYDFLLNNQPNEDLVLVHGDYCLPNSFIKDNKTVGFIDLGNTGVADRWQDLALAIRSLKHNLCNIRGMSQKEFDELTYYLLKLLNIDMNREKLRYYILLDELF